MGAVCIMVCFPYGLMTAVRRQRRRRLLAYYLDDLHHAEIFVVEDVAVHHELADVVEVLRIDLHLCGGQDEQRVLPHQLVVALSDRCMIRYRRTSIAQEPVGEGWYRYRQRNR